MDNISSLKGEICSNFFIYDNFQFILGIFLLILFNLIRDVLASLCE